MIVTPAGRVKVLDFGLAKRLSVSELTTQFDATAIEHGTVAGTLAYMAPEQLRGQAAQASADVWALGVMLYEMAHGVRPFQGKTGFELSAAILGEVRLQRAICWPAEINSSSSVAGHGISAPRSSVRRTSSFTPTPRRR